MKHIIIACLFLISAVSYSQTQVDVDDPALRDASMFFKTVDGTPVLNPKFTRIIEGSLYEPANFTKALVFLRNNKRGLSIKGRLSVMDERFHYLDEKGNENAADSPIDEIQFFNGAEMTAYTFYIPGISTKGCYEILEKGKMSLYRKVIKKVQENKTYGSATADQKVITSYSYYISDGITSKQMKKIGDLQEDLIANNPSVKPKLTARKYSDKNPDDWTEVVRVYNAQ